MEFSFTIILIFLFLALYFYTKQKNNEYASILNKKKLSGKEVCHIILDNHFIKEAYVVLIPIIFHVEYDHNRKVIRLSKDLFEECSISSLAFSSFHSTLAVLDKKGEKKLNFFLLTHPLFQLFILIFYFLFLWGIILNEPEFISLSFGLFLLIIVYSFFSVFVLKRVGEVTKKELIKNKMITKEEETAIDKMFQIIFLYYFCEIIHYPYSLFQKIMKR